MFSSPCSLRSAQCATLIALAAAAGISRTEPAGENTAAPAPKPVATATASTLPTRFSYPVAASASEWSHWVAASVSEWNPFVAASASERTAPDCLTLAPETITTTPPTSHVALAFSAFLTPALSARRHSYPYAVGPPRRGIDPSLRVAGTALPGDSSARRIPFSRIAHRSNLILRARDMRATDHGPESAGSILSPGSALSGEPGFVSSPARHLVRLRAPASSDYFAFPS